MSAPQPPETPASKSLAEAACELALDLTRSAIACAEDGKTDAATAYDDASQKLIGLLTAAPVS